MNCFTPDYVSKASKGVVKSVLYLACFTWLWCEVWDKLTGLITMVYETSWLITLKRDKLINYNGKRRVDRISRGAAAVLTEGRRTSHDRLRVVRTLILSHADIPPFNGARD